jgi:hypothetical protein
MTAIGGQSQKTSPGGTNVPKILGFVGLGFVCLAAILAFFFSIKNDLVFYLWIAGLTAQFEAGLWVLFRRFFG